MWRAVGKVRPHCTAVLPIRNDVLCVNGLSCRGVAVAERKEAENWEVGRLSAFSLCVLSRER
jgi:hypothetical protein